VRSLLLGVTLIGLLTLLVRLIGGRMSKSHHAASRIVLAHPPDMVWAVIRNQQDVSDWWTEVKKVDRLPDIVGQERWRQTLGNNFAMTLVIAESIPQKRLRTVIDAEPGAAFGGTWIYEIAPSSVGTEVTITEDGWIANPFFRVFARIMGHHRTIDGYLSALSRRFAESAAPTHLS
jgi:uncharacterized protein YndB with AHSA1/START domain